MIKLLTDGVVMGLGQGVGIAAVILVWDGVRDGLRTWRHRQIVIKAERERKRREL